MEKLEQRLIDLQEAKKKAFEFLQKNENWYNSICEEIIIIKKEIEQLKKQENVTN